MWQYGNRKGNRVYKYNYGDEKYCYPSRTSDWRIDARKVISKRKAYIIFILLLWCYETQNLEPKLNPKCPALKSNPQA